MVRRIRAAGHGDAMSYDHAALRASYQPGQRWEYLRPGSTEWKPCAMCGNPTHPAEPLWQARTRYRLIADAAADNRNTLKAEA